MKKIRPIGCIGLVAKRSKTGVGTYPERHEGALSVGMMCERLGRSDTPTRVHRVRSEGSKFFTCSIMRGIQKTRSGLCPIYSSIESTLATIIDCPHFGGGARSALRAPGAHLWSGQTQMTVGFGLVFWLVFWLIWFFDWFREGKLLPDRPSVNPSVRCF